MTLPSEGTRLVAAARRKPKLGRGRSTPPPAAAPSAAAACVLGGHRSITDRGCGGTCAGHLSREVSFKGKPATATWLSFSEETRLLPSSFRNAGTRVHPRTWDTTTLDSMLVEMISATHVPIRNTMALSVRNPV